MNLDVMGGEARKVGLSDPLLIFPAEIWEYIMKMLCDSRDIQNVFRAIPVLECLVLKNKYWWLLDQILPHIFPYMAANEVLSCRRICQRWSQVVDNFLNTFPTLGAANDELDIKDQLWNTESSQANEFHTPQHMFVRCFNPRHSHLLQSMSGLIQNRNGNSTRRNPIVGRSVELSDNGIHETLPAGIGRLEYGEELARRCANFWSIAVEYIRSLGDQIWFLSLNFDYFVSLGNIWSVVIDSLHSLSNLKLLRIESMDHDSDLHSQNMYDARWLKEYLTSVPQELRLQVGPLPLLSHLQCLQLNCMSADISELPPDTVSLLIARYSNQIQKLEISYGHANKGICGYFPNLAECILTDYDKQTAINTLLALDAPELQCLEVSYAGCEDGVESNSNDIITCLGRFKKLSKFCLDLSPFPVVRRGVSELNEFQPFPLATSCTHITSHNHITSLKSFKMDCFLDTDMRLDFLQRFPSLEHLKIAVYEGCEKLQVEFPNMFEMLPKLKKVNLHPHYLDQHTPRSYIFTRVKYEQAKGNWGLVNPSPSPCIFDALRACCFPWDDLGQPQHFNEVDSEALE